MTARYQGLTWDHPRGYNALAASGGELIQWDRHKLEGFESRPIAEQCALYDLVVLDHPHVGEAVAAGCLYPLEELFGAEEIAGWQAAAIGCSFASYHYAGAHWALPLDAATQVMACRRDMAETPESWDAVIALAGRAPVALSLAGPHAALSFQSVAAALGLETRLADGFMPRDIAREAYAIMARLTGDATRAAVAMNPITMLEAMAAGDGPALCPLIYGYVNYSAAGTVRYADAPHGPGGRRIGSMLGGTGIAVSRRAEVTPALLDHLRWLLSDAAQCTFIPQHQGQPSSRSAWADPAVDRAAQGFYSATGATLEAASLRPRHNGAIAFQTEASALLRAGLIDQTAADTVLDAVEAAYRHHHPAGAER